MCNTDVKCMILKLIFPHLFDELFNNVFKDYPLLITTVMLLPYHRKLKLYYIQMSMRNHYAPNICINEGKITLELVFYFVLGSGMHKYITEPKIQWYKCDM